MNDDPNLKAQHRFSTKLKTGLHEFSAFALFFLMCLVLFRLVELILIQISQGLPFGFFELFSKGLLVDVLFWINILPFAGILFLILSLVSLRLAKISYGVIMVIFFCVNLLLIYYHKESLLLLGSDVFGYTYADVSQTVGASGVLSFTSLGLFVLSLGLLIGGIIYLLPKLLLKWVYSLGLLLFAVVLLLFNAPTELKPHYSEDFANNLITNKSQHFYNAATAYYFGENYEPDIYADNYFDLLNKRLAQQSTFNYNYPEYPFLHDADTADVLSSFLKQKTNPPNLVFIVVEGLGRAFTNDGAYLGNFTPFLDSLSKQSLYFKNMLSNGGRTFAVLPSMLGSEPFANNGFLAMEDNMPAQLSLLNILEKNGYQSNFYYGGDASFDNMEGYLKLNKVDRIIDENSFPSNFSKLPEFAGYSWGYGDKELYNYYFENTKDDTLQAPRLDVLLTVTTHSPFKLLQQQKYLNRFNEHLKSLDLKPEESAQRKNFADQFATVLYADAALRNFFNQYQKRADYQNTIFFITGDHRIPEIPLSTKIDRYHVPLIVYSPLLKRTKEIQSISSHFDITPSVLNYLHNAYDVPMPRQNAFLGKGLDSLESFRNRHQIPLMQTKTDLLDFVMETYHLNGDRLYQIFPDLYEEEIVNEVKKEELKAAFAEFKRRNREIAEGRKLVPDSIVLKYAQ